MSQTKTRLSLWLSPHGAEEDRLKSLIHTLASQTPGCLPFDPHLTLISDDQVPVLPLDQVLQLVSTSVKQWNSSCTESDEFKLNFQKALTGQLFYQCVFLTVLLDDSLSRLNGILRESFVPDPTSRAGLTSYFPHVSIAYGDLTQDLKDELLERVQTSLAGMSGYSPTEVLVVDTSGPSTDWKKLASVSLKDGSIASFIS